MRNLIVGIPVFFFTMFTGIAGSFVWFIPVQFSNRGFVSSPVENSTETTSTREADPPIEPLTIKIEVCTEIDRLKEPGSNWKGKGVIYLGVVNRRVACGALPEYPLEAKKENVSGMVEIEVLIDETGEVKDVKPKYGNFMLLKAAQKAAKQTRLIPTMLGGAAYKAKGVLVYKFDIKGDTWLQGTKRPR